MDSFDFYFLILLLAAQLGFSILIFDTLVKIEFLLRDWKSRKE